MTADIFFLFLNKENITAKVSNNDTKLFDLITYINEIYIKIKVQTKK